MADRSACEASGAHVEITTHHHQICGVRHHVRTVKVGDRVLFHLVEQYEVEIIMRERDLHAVADERPGHGTGRYL